jgi:hypothetical protein
MRLRIFKLKKVTLSNEVIDGGGGGFGHNSEYLICFRYRDYFHYYRLELEGEDFLGHSCHCYLEWKGGPALVHY